MNIRNFTFILSFLISLTYTANATKYVYSTGVVTQETGYCAPSANDQEVLRIAVSVGATIGPNRALIATQIQFTMQNEDDADVANAKLYYTATSATFAADSQLGATIPTPTGTITFSGFTKNMNTAATYYYWLAYDIAASPTVGDSLDAFVPTNGLTFTEDAVPGVTYTPIPSNPSGSRTADGNMTYSSSTTTQTNTTDLAPDSTDQEMIGIEIVTVGTLGPAVTATSFSLNTTGTTDATGDISNAKLWYTGTSSTFATTTQFGSTEASPSGSYSITGSQALSTGTNYFWLTYDINIAATVNNFADGECTSVTVGSAQSPTITAPAGNREIDYVVFSRAYVFTSASSVTPGTAVWGTVDPNSIDADNGIISNSGTVGFGSWTEYLETYQLTGRPDVPSNAIIRGIVFSMHREKGVFSGADTEEVQLIKGGTRTGDIKAMAWAVNGSGWPRSDYGSNADLWGTTWTPAEINAANFGVSMRVKSSAVASTFEVDYYKMGVFYSVPPPLPIELGSLEAVAQGNKVSINWTTVTELNNDYFSIENSKTGDDWKVLGTMKGAGNSSSELSYSFLDKDPYAGNNYYRLKQTDYDGKYKYSDIINVNVNEMLNTMNVFPNPSSGRLNIELTTNEAEALIVVYDIYGAEQYTRVMLNENDGIYSAIDLSGKLTPGVYLVKATTNDNVFEKRIVVR